MSIIKISPPQVQTYYDVCAMLEGSKVTTLPGHGMPAHKEAVFDLTPYPHITFPAESKAEKALIEALSDNIHLIKLRCNRLQLTGGTTFKNELEPILTRNYLLTQLQHGSFIRVDENGLENFAAPANSVGIDGKDILADIDDSGNAIPNSIVTAKDIQKLTNTIANLNNSQTLDLSGCSLGDAGVFRLVGILRTQPKLLQKIRHLKLSRNNIGPEGVKALMTLPLGHLQSLFLDNNAIKKEGVAALAEASAQDVGGLCNLKELDLSSNHLFNGSAPFLANILTNNAQLHALILKYNNLCDLTSTLQIPIKPLHNPNPSNFCKFTRAIEQHKSLAVLNLGHNNLASGVDYLAQAIDQHPSLKRLTLKANSITPTIGKTLMLALKNNNSLNSLDLRYNKIGKNFVEKLSLLLHIKPRYFKVLLSENYGKVATNIGALNAFHATIVNKKTVLKRNTKDRIKQCSNNINQYLVKRCGESDRSILGYSHTDYLQRLSSWKALEQKLRTPGVTKAVALEQVKTEMDRFSHGFFRQKYSTLLTDLFRWLSRLPEENFAAHVRDRLNPSDNNRGHNANVQGQVGIPR